MRYRRSGTPGGTYFFTVVTFARRKFLCHPDNVTLLREAFQIVKRAHPFGNEGEKGTGYSLTFLGRPRVRRLVSKPRS
jgi:hypothetical protein